MVDNGTGDAPQTEPRRGAQAIRRAGRGSHEDRHPAHQPERHGDGRRGHERPRGLLTELGRGFGGSAEREATVYRQSGHESVGGDGAYGGL